jgi:hypothetical protein
MNKTEMLSVSLLDRALDELCILTDELGRMRSLEKAKVLVAKVRELLILEGEDMTQSAEDMLSYKKDMERQTRLAHNAEELIALSSALIEELAKTDQVWMRDMVNLQKLIKYIEDGQSQH